MKTGCKQSDESMRSDRIFRLALVVYVPVVLILAFLFQGTRGIWQPDEGYYTGTALTMLDKGSLFIPYLGEDEIFLDKPPLIYWGIIAGLRTFGHSEFGVRFFHGLCFVLTSAVVGILSFSLFKNRWTALLSSLVYATMVIPFVASNFVTPDTILTLWTTVCALFFWKSVKSTGKSRILWQMLLCVSAGFGFLSKGPAVLIPCCGMFVFLAARKEAFRYFLTWWSVAGILLFLFIGLGWYIWIGFRLPGAFSYFVDNQIVGRLITEKYNRNPGLQGGLIYIPVLVFGSLPWSAIWLEKLKFIKTTFLSKQWWKTLPDRPQQMFLLSWFFVPLVILCLASSKLGLYTLPIFVPLAIATTKLWQLKAPVTDIGSLRRTLSVFSKPIILTGVWIILLLISKLGIAYYPTCHNMKALWAQIKHRLPTAKYELCSVNERADGLLFYGVKKIEHVTAKNVPYPTFTKTGTMLEEVQEHIEEGEDVFFLVAENDDMMQVIKMLKNSGLQCRIIPLGYQRAMIYPYLLKGKGENILQRI
ncbi:MAG: glycosyltransferase family 39 protein [Planctomycetota bacterium]